MCMCVFSISHLSLASLVFLGTERSNKYEIKDNFGQRLYFAREENIYLNKNLCGPLRPFTMHIANNTGREVITVIRPLRCITCCFPCYLQEVSDFVLITCYYYGFFVMRCTFSLLNLPKCHSQVTNDSNICFR